MDPSPETTVNHFNEAINDRDIDRLAGLMTDDHAFVDSAGSRVESKADAIAAWTTFFDLFPDYRNVFERMSSRGAIVAIVGHSVCPSNEALDGRALWTARIEHGRVAEWRVHEDTAENRARLGITE